MARMFDPNLIKVVPNSMSEFVSLNQYKCDIKYLLWLVHWPFETCTYITAHLCLSLYDPSMSVTYTCLTWMYHDTFTRTNYLPLFHSIAFIYSWILSSSFPFLGYKFPLFHHSLYDRVCNYKSVVLKDNLFILFHHNHHHHSNSCKCNWCIHFLSLSLIPLTYPLFSSIMVMIMTVCKSCLWKEERERRKSY